MCKDTKKNESHFTMVGIYMERVSAHFIVLLFIFKNFFPKEFPYVTIFMYEGNFFVQYRLDTE